MARIQFKRGDEYAIKLSRLTNDSEEISKRAIYEAADLVTNKIRRNLEANLQGSRTTTGALMDSLGITPMQQDAAGDYNVKVGFDGYDGRGVPNPLKARVMESGTSKIPKRPFVAPAVRATQNAALKKMRDVIDEEIQKRMN